MPNKKTNDEFLNELSAKNVNIIPLELYKDNNSKILVRCAVCGYEWQVLPRSILSGHGCPKCNGRILRTTNEFIEKLYAVNPDIVVLGEYRGSKNNINVKCKKCGFEWSPVANSIMSQGTGCPQCAGNIKLSNEQFVSQIKKMTPTISITSKYKNANSRVNCECQICGYKWSAYANSLMAGTGCAKCAGIIKKNKESFEKQLKEIIPSIIVVGEYINAHTKIAVCCKICGHEWSAKPNNLLNGEGCPKCANKTRTAKQTKSEKDFRKQVLHSNPQIEIIGNYVNSHSRIKCRCKLCDHIWNPMAYDVVNGTGCPECSKTSTSYMEQIILQSLRMVLGEKAILSRNRTVVGMELDIFIPDCKIAIEPGSWFWHSEKIDKDREKRERCKKAGIRLITIYDSFKSGVQPFDEDCLVYDFDIGSEEQHPTLRRIIEGLLVQVNRNYSFTDEEWEKIEEIAYIKSHRMTTDDFAKRLEAVNDNVNVIGNYKGYKIKIACICKNCGHEWNASPGHLLQGQGCPKCYGNIRKSIEEFRKDLLRVAPTISILSDKYVNNRDKIKVSCNICGHVWDARPANLLSGYGCPECGKRRISENKRHSHEMFLNKMIEQGNPNVIIRGKYVNYKTKIQCQCKTCGNEWKATPNSLLQGHGCKLCADLATGKAIRDSWNKRRKGRTDYGAQKKFKK